ncbi:hypothetical protein PG993_014554 [Apiospora rasikravindrae]|uniref:Uncharacterized protein n=1 Tax=Apiospora rasikravindrae TaxID=990691 RepID=A0ABR1RN33_9PEZI
MATTKKVQFGQDQHLKATTRPSSPMIGKAIPLTPVYYSKPFSNGNHSHINNNRGGLFLAKIEYYNHDPRQRDSYSLEAIDLSSIITTTTSTTARQAGTSSDIVEAIEAHQRGRIERLYPDAPSGGFTVGRARVLWNMSVAHPECPGPELTQLPRDEVREQLELMKNRGYVDCIHIKIDVARRSRELVRYVTTPQSMASSSSSPSWQV